jgi:ADP-dependent NAD(P)H-hydrate dehydratase / NAD(P)H-hydrate epimerase
MPLEPWLEGVYDAERMRATDEWAIQQQGVPSLELMEAAGRATARAGGDVARSERVSVVCGKGNNAGDGLVAARAMAETGYEVEALFLWPAGELSPDAQSNLERYSGPSRQVAPEELGDALARSGAVIDAIFGTGFSGAARAPADTAIEAINGADAPVVAADIASGVDASTGEVDGAAVRADVSVSFHAAKLGHWIAPGKEHAGEVRVAEIGIPADAPTEAAAGLIRENVLSLAPPRAAASTKFSSGQVLVVGGSRGLTGAVCMAAEAAIRAGAGYATVAVPRDLEHIFEIKLTEVMSQGFAGAEGNLGPEAGEPILEAAERAAAVALGPGMGRAEGAFELARSLAPRLKAPLLIDADGLNAHAGRLDSLCARDAPTVLTPHAGELARLLETDSDHVSAHRLACTREAAQQSGAIVVLKGDDTLVVGGDRVAINRFGSPALATAGTGDVLSGVISALLARGVEPFAAACAGVLAHARAGRVAGERAGIESVIATDVIEAVPRGLALE